MPEDYRQELKHRLGTVFEALSKTSFLKNIFDNDWYRKLGDEIDKADLTIPFRCDSALMFFELDHPLRGTPLLEEAHTLIDQGKEDKLDRNAKLAIKSFGPDPLRTFLPLLDQRLVSFSESQFKQSEISRKIRELHANRFKPDLRNHLFELSVLGFFALKGVLTDIEVPVPVGHGSIDGEIRLDGRPILVEVTFTSQELLTFQPGVSAVAISPLVKQVVDKIRKKVAEGRQLAAAKCVPSLLFLGRNRLGADRVTAQRGIQECFSDPGFSRLSGVVVSDSWKLLTTEFHVGPNPEIRLSGKEMDILRRWFGSSGCS
jgi:hypothetical protein